MPLLIAKHCDTVAFFMNKSIGGAKKVLCLDDISILPSEIQLFSIPMSLEAIKPEEFIWVHMLITFTMKLETHSKPPGVTNNRDNGCIHWGVTVPSYLAHSLSGIYKQKHRRKVYQENSYLRGLCILSRGMYDPWMVLVTHSMRSCSSFSLFICLSAGKHISEFWSW